MSSINVNHLQLHDFSDFLQKKAGRFDQIKLEIETSIKEAKSNGWDDNKWDEFYRIFNESKKFMEDLTRILNSYSQYISQKAQIVGIYQSNSIF